MKHILTLNLTLFLVLSVIGCSSDGQSQSQETVIIDQDLQIRSIGESTYLITHSFPWPANSLLVQTDGNSAILIDTPYTSEATEKVMSWAEEKLKIEQFTAINTHFHLDNCGGNNAVLDQSGTVYATEYTAELIAEKGKGHLDQLINYLQGEEMNRFRKVYEAAVVMGPNQTFELPDIGESLQLDIEDTKVVVFYPGPAHSHDNISIYLPSQNILFAGCSVKSSHAGNLGNLADGSPSEYGRSIERLIGEYSETENLLIIPGHGEPGGVELLYHTLELSKDLEK